MTSAREAIETASLTGQPVGHILASELNRASYARRIPIGVVGVITPWEFAIYSGHTDHAAGIGNG